MYMHVESEFKKKMPESTQDDTHKQDTWDNLEVCVCAVVCIPTRLSTAETERLVPDLLNRGVGLRHLVVNQILRSTQDSEAFLDRRRKEQKKVQMLHVWLGLLGLRVPARRATGHLPDT